MRFLGPLWICLQNRRLFNTALGRFGFGSAQIEKGDVVCILNGASTAHVLRPQTGSDGSSYYFIGEAYVHGMMHGEIGELCLREQDIYLV
jgi:hypothetical protein